MILTNVTIINIIYLSKYLIYPMDAFIGLFPFFVRCRMELCEEHGVNGGKFK
jgi:hypothetical protein